MDKKDHVVLTVLGLSVLYLLWPRSKPVTVAPSSQTNNQIGGFAAPYLSSTPGIPNNSSTPSIPNNTTTPGIPNNTTTPGIPNNTIDFGGFAAPYFNTTPGYPDNTLLYFGNTGQPFVSDIQVNLNVNPFNSLTQKYIPLYGFIGMAS